MLVVSSVSVVITVQAFSISMVVYKHQLPNPTYVYLMFSENKLEYVATMVCVAVDGHPTIGIIHKPFINDNKGETG